MDCATIILRIDRFKVFFGETDQQVVLMQDDLGKAQQSGSADCEGDVSVKSGCCVSSEEPGVDPKAGCNQRLREKLQADMLAEEREEILRHKWIESEKAQRDLGAEAVLDWILRYAAQWRRWYEGRYSAKKS